MQLTNFIGPDAKIVSIIGGASSLLIGSLYISGASTIAISSMIAAPAIILTLGVSYFSRDIINYTFGETNNKSYY